jgi:hypothetical protein
LMITVNAVTDKTECAPILNAQRMNVLIMDSL